MTNVEHAVTEADIIEHVLGPTPLSLVLLGWGMPNLDITVTARVTGSPESEAVEMGRLTPRTPSLKSIAEVVELRPDNR